MLLSVIIQNIFRIDFMLLWVFINWALKKIFLKQNEAVAA